MVTVTVGGELCPESANQTRDPPEGMWTAKLPAVPLEKEIPLIELVP